MPTELIIQSNQYLNQYKNGATFGSSTSDVTYNLAGNAMEKLQYTTTIDVSWKFNGTANNPIIWEDLGSDLFRFKKSNGSFITDGFAVGDDVDWSYFTGGTPYLVDGDVTIILSDWMYIQFTTTPAGLTATSGQSSAAIIWGKSSLE